jgi:aspartyl-tRNA(Asn)/glutamyl-tRNA(Gln) amidotransferase subunit C
MKVTEQDVLYVADLANLELTEEERPSMQRDLNSILRYIEKLNALDTSNVEPLAEVASKFAGTDKQGSARFEFALRPDESRPGLSHDMAMKNAPENDGTFFKVPKVIDK